jgi:hypothetical protein
MGKHMSKTTFVDNCSATAVCGLAVVIGKVYDLITGKFHSGDTVALLTGDQYVDTFQGNKYVCHKVLVFDSNEQPSSIELMAKSAHSYSTYGPTTNPKPQVGTRLSKKGHSIPDLELVDSQSPFRFKCVSMGRDAEGNELINAKVDQIQYAKVTGFATYWVAEYGVDGDVILDDEVCRMKYVRKPIFEIITPSNSIKKEVEKFISSLAADKK